MKLKKFLAMLCVVAMVGGLPAACGAPATEQSTAPAAETKAPETDSTAPSGGPIRLGTIYAMSGGNAAIGQELIRCVELYKDEYGFDLVDTIDYSSNATDLSAQVLALKQANPDAILRDSYIGDAAVFVQTLSAQSYKPKMIVAKANGFTDPGGFFLVY